MCSLAQVEGLCAPKYVIHPRVMFHLALHCTSNTSTSSLTPTCPVLLSSSTPNPDLLSPTPSTHCKDPRQDGSSTELQSSTLPRQCTRWIPHVARFTRPAAASCRDELRKGLVSCRLIVGTVSRCCFRMSSVLLRARCMVMTSLSLVLAKTQIHSKRRSRIDQDCLKRNVLQNR